MSERLLIESRVKDTIGYAEAENKNSFMVGAGVAFSKTEELFKERLAAAERGIESYKSAYEEVLTDIRTFVSIMDKYRENE